MLKKVALCLLMATGITACSYIAYRSLFRPVIFEKTISGFDIPINAKLVTFKEEWSEFNGDGYALSKLTVDDTDFVKIVKQCKVDNYRALPVNQARLEFSDGNIDEIIAGNDVGFYKAVSLKDQFSITIVDIRRHVVTTYISVF